MYKIRPIAYIFTHQYLNTMQKGIQSLHVTSELFISNYNNDDSFGKIFNWAKNEKTVCLLNGGVGDDFITNTQEASRLAKKYELPFAGFREPDIYDIVTAFGFIITPDIIKDIEKERRVLISQGYEDDPLLDAHELVEFLKKFNLAT